MTTFSRHLLAPLVAAALAAAGHASAQETPVSGMLDEAVAVHSIATAARLCNVITESELTRSVNRLDRVHTAQLDARGRETYLIMRGSDSFRNMVFASALRRAQAGCQTEVPVVWRDIHASLVMADTGSGSPQVMGGAPTP
jgi:hypothetical protein